MLKSRGWDLILTFSLLPFVFVVMKKVAGTAFFLNSCTCSSGMLEFNLFSPNEFITIGPEMLLFSPLLNCIFFFIIILLFFMLMWPEGWKTHVFSTVWFFWFFPPTTQMTHGKKIQTAGLFPRSGISRSVERESFSRTVPDLSSSPVGRSVSLNRESSLPETTRRPGFPLGMTTKTIKSTLLYHVADFQFTQSKTYDLLQDFVLFSNEKQ